MPNLPRRHYAPGDTPADRKRRAERDAKAYDGMGCEKKRTVSERQFRQDMKIPANDRRLRHLHQKSRRRIPKRGKHG